MTTEDLIPEGFHQTLATRLVGKKLHRYKSLTSTMEEALNLARQGAPEGAVVLADYQTAGRGRFDRKWLSQPGVNILISVIFRPTAEQLPMLNMAAALSVTKAVARYPGVSASIKWPNDILVKGRKLCGILIDSYYRDGRLDFAIVGMGLNVNMDVSRFPEIASISTSLSMEAGHPVSRATVLANLLQELDSYYAGIQAGRPIHNEWRQHVSTIGQNVRVTSAGKVLEGVAIGVTDSGDLRLRLTDGQELLLNSGEVSLTHA